ncbi:Transcriptional repressor tup11-related protein [Histomonas meleagridis]|uniref:Transcriptional repressor tup11-related protein n=1 Tax=Histomonas meleagridis TaxID=135588 RepID=UPI003559B4E1|nr:Transcriptional repressor tup11-related protein [Histomonas meleagridis]KAH0796906.1 Transcriptional repressor tup11-related protein [Histomonas meleagridis]
MSYLSTSQMNHLLDQLSSKYECLLEARKNLETDCLRLRDNIDQQVLQIHSLSEEFRKLKQEFIAKKGVIEKNFEKANEESNEPNYENSPEWELDTLVPPEKITCPVIIGLIAEIYDLSPICSTSFSQDGNFLAIGTDKTLRVYAIEQDDFAFEYTIGDKDQEVSQNHIRSILFSKDGQKLITGSEDACVRMFNIPNKVLTDTININNGEIFQVQISHNEEFIVIASGNGSVTVFPLNDFTRKREFKCSDSTAATTVAISDDDKYLFVGYSNTNIGIWDIESGKQIYYQSCHVNGIYSLILIENSTRLVTASLGKTIKIWDIVIEDEKATLNPSKTLEGHQEYVLTLAADPTYKWLVSGSKDLTVRISDLKTGEMIYSLKGHTNTILTVAFNPNGSMFCSGSADKTVKLWSISPEQAIE